MHAQFFFFFLILRGREGGKGVVFLSHIRILILSLGGLLQNNYYIFLLSGRQLNKTDSFFW